MFIWHCDGGIGIVVSQEAMMQWKADPSSDEKLRGDRDKNLANEFLASIKPSCVLPLGVHLLKPPKKPRLSKLVTLGRGEEREKDSGKETFYLRIWRFQNDRRNCHTFKGGPGNMKAGVAWQALDLDCLTPASRTALLIYKEQVWLPLGDMWRPSFSSLEAGRFRWSLTGECWRKALPSFKVLVISKFIFFVFFFPQGIF